jgi:dipeptidyl aminopeptidase/acylaminoacyl peptidase
MKNRFFFAVLSMMLANILFSQTLSDYLSQPFPTMLKASPNGKHLAWVMNEQGSRNVILCSTPFDQAIKITNNQSDNGIEIPELHISNNDIVYVRGNSPNPRGEIANPAMVKENIERTIFKYSFASGKTDTIAKGTSIRISPDGSMLAYITGNQIWTKSLVSNEAPKKLSQLRGGTSSLVWSPKSDRIAFVSQRGDHSFIGIAELQTQKVYFINESLDKDMMPSWSGDGSMIAYLRMPTVHQQMLFMPIRSSLPWSIWITNLSDMKSKSIFTASEGMGSHLSNSVWIADQAIIWNGEADLIFPYEKNGWNQLYSININTAKLSHLTPGEGEVEWMSMTKDKKQLFYLSNIGDLDRKHINLLDLTTLKTSALTSGETINVNPVQIEEGWAFLQSDHAKTPWPTILKSATTKEIATTLKSKTFPVGLRKPQPIKITATDGHQIPAQLFLPKDYDPKKKYPATIFLHGGSRRQMLLGFNFSQYYSNSFALNQFMADKGYIVISLNYRSGIGYGVNFREALDYGPFGASEVRDVIGTGIYLKSRGDVDEKRLSLWGGSYGGYLTAHGLAQASDIFSCGVDIHGVHDWNDGVVIFNTWFEKSEMPEFAKLAEQSSPLNFMKSWKSPVLLIHADDDRNVAFNQSVRLIEQLRRQKVYHEQIVLPDDIHNFLLHKNWVSTLEATFDFLNRNGVGK